MLERLAHVIVRRRWWVIGVWIVLTIVGAFSAGQLSKRWFQSFSIPGYAGYETNQKTLKLFGSGEYPPMLAVFHTNGDITKVAGLQKAVDSAATLLPKSRSASFWTTGSRAYVSKDGHTAFATIYPAGNQDFTSNLHIKEIRAKLKAATPAGTTAYLTGRDPLVFAESSTSGPSVLTESLIGGLGALVILLFVFGTMPAVLIPIAIAIASILNTFTLVYLLTYVTHVSIIVQYLIALVGLGVAIDYALLMIFRFRDELRDGSDTETAMVQTMTHAGRSVIVSGSTVAVGLLSMVFLPLPFIRSIGIGGLLIPLVSVIAAITLLPAILSTLGTKVNSLRVLPKRLMDDGHAEDGWWGRWAGFVVRHPWPIAAVGLVIVGALVFEGFQLNPSEAQVKYYPGSGDAIDGRQALAAAGISAGVMKPFVVLVNPGTSSAAIVKTLDSTQGIAGAVAPAAWQKDGYRLIEAFPAADGSSGAGKTAIKTVRAELNETGAALGGVAVEERDFVSAVYGNFPYVLAFVITLTLILLARAFRSVVLALKAALLNLISLAAAYGIIVFIFQKGHGSETIWGIHATQSIIPWIPLMIFAFLFGLSMDYEVFLLTRMREIYDQTGDTDTAIRVGLARTGKLVTSAALVLMFAFFTLSLSPGLDIKQFAIGLAAGIIFDATVIRVVLVPSLMKILGVWNWWLPAPAAKVLLVREPGPPEPALDSA
jgi:putative drug exporter of the RND superfamily